MIMDPVLYGFWSYPLYVFVRPLPVCMYLIVSIKYLQFQGNKCSNQHWPLGTEAVYTGRHGYIRESMCCNGSTVTWNARDVGSSLTLGTILPIFIKQTTLAKGWGAGGIICAHVPWRRWSQRGRRKVYLHFQKLHSSMTFVPLHYLEINISDMPFYCHIHSS